jgi:hypothetical protein
MGSEINASEHIKPIPGWACLSIGFGFIITLTILIVGVRLLGGQ